MKPLGKVLQQADLISSEQIEIALKEQTQLAGLRLGEILAAHGWLKQETADFFSQQWPALLKQKPRQSLGKYLKDAGLLNEQQIKIILAEQPQKKLRFGELAVLKGWLKPTTIKFFLENLALEDQMQHEEVSTPDSPTQAERLQKLIVPQQNDSGASNSSIEQSVFDSQLGEQESSMLRLFSRSTIKLFKLDEKASRPDVVMTEVLSWTNGQPILTQKLCRLLADLPGFIPAGAEAATLQQLVQTRLIHHWETQLASEHLQRISDSIIHNQQCDPLLLLELYQQVLQQGGISTNNSPEQTELLEIGLVRQRQKQLRVSNRIYQSVFDANWVKQELAKLRLLSHSTIKLFKLEEKASCPEVVMTEVMFWTDGQPILTQKLCRLLAESQELIPAGAEAATVQQLVKSRLIHRWETQVAGEHLQGIRNSIIRNQQCDPLSLLELYEQILYQGEVPTNNSPEQAELLRLKLLVQQQDQLRVANRIYKSVFDANWINRESARLRLLSRGTIQLFKLEEKASYPDAVLSEVIFWTDGQPILTQQVCQLLAESEVFIPAGAEAATVHQLIQTRLINNWETQVASEHLQEIRAGIIHNRQCDPLRLLELYQQIWQQGEVPINASREQTELLRWGLVVQQQDKLKLGNRIYQSVFDRHWVERELEKILLPSMAKTTLYNPIPSGNTLNVSNTLAPPEPSITKRIWVLLLIAGLMVCGSGLMVLGFFVFRWLQVETIFKRGNELLHQGEYQQAIAKYNKLLKLDSNYYQSWTNRGYALAGMKDYNQMLESCTTATIINPEAVYAWNCRGEALYNLKQYNEAIAAFDKAIMLNAKDPVFWINKTEALLALKQPDTALTTVNQAIELLRAIWEVERKDANAKELAIGLSYQAKVFLQKQEYEGSLKAYEQALKYNPQYFAALRGKGIALQALKRDDQAIAQFYFLLDRHQLTNPQKAEIWYYLGLSLCEFRQTEKAIAAFDQALKLKPDYQAAEQGKKACYQ
ncbi:MAG: tetratricopeptide repeat protein [Aulosira sp. ZfuVER01]|nr:tetratricopeptide repeat protein [Aulosira sp. ZfuVER01]MDZ7997862.1 tetratricopeptide repeat protein [Aulosira sp. DedVER01a]MDZ8052356.1 tetratricopeptide repeat protein [Aulosira sp. ZfuCHP01]